MRKTIPNQYLVSNIKKLNPKTRKFSGSDPPYNVMLRAILNTSNVDVINEMEFIETILIHVRDDEALMDLKKKLPTCTIVPNGINKL